MPYIKPEFREQLYVGEGPHNSGELNYILTKECIGYLNSKGKSYQTMNDIVGALDNCKDEFRRRVQHPYEDAKIRGNGDVYPSEFVTELLV